MRAKAKGSWEAEGRPRRRARWTAAGASSPVRATEDPVAQRAWGQTAAGVAEAAETASVTAAFPLEVGQRAEGLLAAAPEG